MFISVYYELKNYCKIVTILKYFTIHGQQCVEGLNRILF